MIAPGSTLRSCAAAVLPTTPSRSSWSTTTTTSSRPPVPASRSSTAPRTARAGAAGGLILVTTDELQAYDANSGDLVWTRPASAGVTEVCLAGELQEAPGVVVCAATETARAADPDRTVTVTVLDPATGEELVRLQRPGSLLGGHLVGDDVVLALA